MTARCPLFVFGFPRSGTTLLRSVIGQHSGVMLFNEPNIILALRHADYGTGSVFPPETRSAVLEDLKKIGLCRRHLKGLEAERLAGFLNDGAALGFADLYERLLPKPSDGRLLWGEKSNNNLFFIPEIASLYPNAVYVHIVRDARATALSYFKKKSAGAPRMEGQEKAVFSLAWLKAVGFFAQRAALWRTWMSVACRMRKLVDAEAWVEIRYEDFLEAPHAMLRRVCAAAGIEFEERMVDSKLRGSDPVLKFDVRNAHRKLTQDFDTSRARSHEALPPEMIWVVEKKAGPALERAGYAPIRPRIPGTRRLLLEATLAVRYFAVRREIRAYLEKRGVTAERLRALKTGAGLETGP